MPNQKAYLYNQAGQAVAAVHLGIVVRQVSADPAAQPTEVVLPRGDPKARLILALTGLAAERKGAGASNPLRRMRNRQRISAQLASVVQELKGTEARRRAQAASLKSQAQDRANAICSSLYGAIENVARQLGEKGVVTGEEVQRIVLAAKSDGRKS
jgi:hypothetical protein